MPVTVPKTAKNAGDILRRVGVEVGLTPLQDPYASDDPAWIRLRTLLNVAGEELVIQHPWQELQTEHNITSVAGDGKYPLPDDFSYLINQTGWERGERVPLFGPLSPQDYQYLYGRQLVTQTIYASFRLAEGQFVIFPPERPGLDIYFEYVSKNWVQAGGTGQFKDACEQNSDTPAYHASLISRYLKVKFLESHDRDTTKAQDDFTQIFLFLTGQNTGAEVLSAGRNRRGFPYLDTYANTPDTQYGMS